MSEPVSFGQWIKRRRTVLDLTQAELAARVACSPQTIRKIEAEARRPSREIADRLATILELSPDEHAVFVHVARSERSAALLGVVAEPPGPPLAHVPRAAQSSRPGVPAPVTPVLGRDAAIATIRALITEGTTRLITLVGPGGVGKTRLAIASVGDHMASVADDVAFVALAALRDPAHVAPAVAQALDVRETPRQSLIESLCWAIGARRLLLVLDNFEHLLPAAPIVATLLQACPHLTVLATSRAPLRLSGEHAYPVPPLELPAAHDATDRVLAAPAVQLFVRRAQAASCAPLLDPPTAAQIAAICRRLDGLPLAIELAAARSTLFAPGALLERLDHRFALLVGGPRDAPARHQTLRAAIAWSYDLLTDEEQRMFRRLAVFAGGWTLPAAAALGDDEPHVLGAVEALLDHHLIERVNGTADEACFDMLETIREFALERLAASGEADAIRHRHAEHYLGVADRAAAQMHGPDQRAWLDRLEAEHDNLRAALGWCVTQGDAAHRGLRLITALTPFWHVRGYWTDGRAWIENILNLPSFRQAAPRLRARALLESGVLIYHMSDMRRALAVFRECQSLAGQRADRQLRARATAWLGHVSCECGAVAEGRVLLERSLDLARAARDPATIARVLTLAGTFREYRKFPHPERLSEEALRIYETLDDRGGEAAVLLNLAWHARWTGHAERAAALAEQSLQLFQALDHTAGVIEAYNCLGCAVKDLRDWERALAIHTAQLAQARRIGNKLETATAHMNMGWVLYDQGRYDAAEDQFNTSLPLYVELGRPAPINGHQSILGRIARWMGAYDRASALLHAALTGFARRRETGGISYVVLAVAGLLGARGQPEQAARLFGAAERYRERHSLPLLPFDQPETEREIASVRHALRANVVTAAWAEGRAMGDAELISFALAALEPPDG